MPISTLLANNRIQLTEAQKRAARYIMDHYEESIFLTASKLAEKAGVSEATIVRFAQVLGFDGYPKLQQMLRTQLQDRLTTVTRLSKLSRISGRTATSSVGSSRRTSGTYRRPSGTSPWKLSIKPSPT